MFQVNKVDAFLVELAETLELPSDTFQNDNSLSSVAWDSLAIISCIALADEYFNVMLTGEELQSPTTTDDIINLIKNKSN